jgi:hypothetical protein
MRFSEQPLLASLFLVGSKESLSAGEEEVPKFRNAIAGRCRCQKDRSFWGVGSSEALRRAEFAGKHGRAGGVRLVDDISLRNLQHTRLE